MKLAKALNDKMMDTRLVDRLIAEGKVSKDELDKHLANLPDETVNMEKVDDGVSTAAAETAPTTEQ